MIELRLLSHSIMVFTCLGSLLMRGSLGQRPILSVGSFTSLSNLQCIRPFVDTLTLEGSVNLNGADPATWIENGVEFRSPQTLICTVSLSQCPPSDHSGCYCEQFNAGSGTYTVKLTRPATASYSEQSIFLQLFSSDFQESVTSGQAIYPYVNEDISATIVYGNKEKSADIDRTDLDIPEDDQEVTMTISGLRQNFTISYSTDISSHNDVQNTNQISIHLNNNETLLTVSYEEDGHCERDGSYSFGITSVQRQSPHLDIASLAAPACPVEGLGVVSFEATVTVPAANISHWDRTVIFLSEHDEDLCSANIGECPPSDVHAQTCYCQQYVADVFTIIGNLEANPLLSGREIHMRMVSSDYSVLQRSKSVVFPEIDRNDVRIAMTYSNDNGNQRYSPPVNNSMLDHPEDNQQLIVTVDGLKEPFSIVYIKLDTPVNIEMAHNRSSVTFSIDDDTRRIQLSYEEDYNCHREAVYFFSFDEGSSDDLSTGAIVGIVFGAILFVVVVIFFVIVYLLVRARDDGKEKLQSPDSFSGQERGTIIDYSSRNEEEGRRAENGSGHDNKAFAADVPANSSSVVMNPVFVEGGKEHEYTSLDSSTQNDPVPSYESLSNGKQAAASASDGGSIYTKPTEIKPLYVDLEDVKPTEATSGDENENGAKGSSDGPHVSIIRTSL